MRVELKSMQSSNIWQILRVFLGLFLLAILIVSVDIEKIRGLILGFSPGYLLVGLLFGFLAVVLSALRWKVVLEKQGHREGLLNLVALYLEALFFNNFLPTSIGGDAIRVTELGKKIGSYSKSFSSILGERVLSTITLGFLSFTSVLFVYEALKQLFVWIVLFFLICIAVFVLFLTVPKFFLSKSGGYIEKFKINNVSRELHKIRNFKTVGTVVLLSLIFQISLVFMNWAIFSGLSVSINPAYYFVFIPITQAISLLPLTFNGLGVREGGYILLFSLVGVEKSVSLTGALAFFVLITVLSLIGGAIFAFRK